jgi:two-component system response regulator HydG
MAIVERRGRVLVVDDDAASCGALKLLLAGEGFDVDQATSGERALELMAERAPDVLLSDIRMPGMDGIELLRRVRAAGDVPVIMMSAEGKSEAAVMAAGAARYLLKPLDIDEVIVALDHVMERARHPA